MKCFTAPFRSSMQVNRWGRLRRDREHQQVAAPNFGAKMLSGGAPGPAGGKGSTGLPAPSQSVVFSLRRKVRRRRTARSHPK